MKVYIVVSQTEGTGGFDWRPEEKDAREIFALDKTYCQEVLLLAFNTEATEREAITEEIDEQLDLFELGKLGTHLDYFCREDKTEPSLQYGPFAPTAHLYYDYYHAFQHPVFTYPAYLEDAEEYEEAPEYDEWVKRRLDQTEANLAHTKTLLAEGQATQADVDQLQAILDAE